MERKARSSRTIWAGALAMGVILVVAVALQADTSRWLSDAWAGLPRPAQDSSISLDGLYLGTVELDWVLPGKYGDPLPTPTPDPGGGVPPELGEIDLGLQLSQSGSAVSGYVDLEFTLVFTVEHTVGSTPYGPSVQGTFDGTNLTLSSERVSMSTAGQRLERQFRLTGGLVPGQDDVLAGEYRETVWGYGPQPLTVIGKFTLAGYKSDVVIGNRVYLPIVTRGR